MTPLTTFARCVPALLQLTKDKLGRVILCLLTTIITIRTDMADNTDLLLQGLDVHIRKVIDGPDRYQSVKKHKSYNIVQPFEQQCICFVT